MTNFTQVFQPISSSLNWAITFNGPDLHVVWIPSAEKHYALDSEDYFCLTCRNFSHQQQFFSELHSRTIEDHRMFCKLHLFYMALHITTTQTCWINLIITLKSPVSAVTL